MKQRVVTVFGSGRANLGDDIYQLAYDIGRLIAERGYALANGGYGGTMEAAASGCLKEAGEVIGVTCSAFGRGSANQYVSREIRTESLDQRLGELVELGDAYIVLPGSTGTLLELAKVWELKNKKLAKSKPIVLLGEFWKPVVELVSAEDRTIASLVAFADSCEKAVEIIDAHFRDSLKS